MKWWRRWRARNKPRAYAGPFFAEREAVWSKDVNFTRNETVFRLVLPVDNALLRDLPQGERKAFIVGALERLADRVAQSYEDAHAAS